MTDKTKPRVTAKSMILDLIGKGRTDEQIIAAVSKAIPASKVDEKHCTKYRKIYSEMDGAKNAAVYAAFGSKQHQAWGNDPANAKARVSAKCPHNAAWKARVARQKAAEKKAA